MGALVLLSVISTAALIGALILVAAWGGLESEAEPMLLADRYRPAGEVVRRFARSVCIALVAGAIAGVLVGGLGGRLAMRIMAATSGGNAQGAITQADEVVGRITLDGTVGLVTFVGVGVGTGAAFLYVLLRRWLPRRAWISGLLFGLLLLAAFGRFEPVDPNSRDFVILSPVWLAVVMFTMLLPLFGLALGSLVARLDAAYPELSACPKLLVTYAPLLIFVPFFPLLIPLVLVGVFAVVAQRIRPLARAWRSPAAHRAGRLALIVVGLVGLGFFGAGVVEILA